MASIYLENNQFLLPRESMGLILDLVMSRICSDEPTQIDLTLMLFKNDLIPDELTAFADLDPADYSGYAPVVLNDTGDCTGFVQGPAQGSDDQWRLIIDQQEFPMTGATVPNQVYGAALVDASGSRLAAIVRFPDAPLVMDEGGDSIKVSGPVILVPQMTPLEE